MNNIQNIIFDMGDILFDASIWRKWLTGFLRNLNVNITYPELCWQWENKLKIVYLGQKRYWNAFGDFLDVLNMSSKLKTQTIYAAQKKAQSIEHRVLFDGVSETLEYLNKNKIKMAILTNTESKESVIRKRLEKLKIDKFIDVIITSIEIGHVKPEPESYLSTMNKLNCVPDTAIFVGHDQDELDGAHSAGLYTVAYNFNSLTKADYFIWHFIELKRFV